MVRLIHVIELLEISSVPIYFNILKKEFLIKIRFLITFKIKPNFYISNKLITR